MLHLALTNQLRRPIDGRVRWLLLCLLLTSGCAREMAVTGVVEDECCDCDDAIVVPGNRNWVETGVDVRAGEAVTVLAQGEITIRHSGLFKRESPGTVGPAGTFFFEDDVAGKPFPLPSAAGGPAPCFCLVGRIGDGPLFFIGARKSWTAQSSGPLKLGINDFNVADNTGQFYARVTKQRTVQPIGFEKIIAFDADSGRPQPGCSVVVFYMDGLRPDVIREMAAMGHLPTIRKHFLDGGAWLSRSFTAFPSDTITSNGTMWTGCFSDRHGLKGQVRFSRRSLFSQSYLEPLGPNRSARLLSPQGVDRIVQNVQTASIGLVKGDSAGTDWRQTQTTGVAPIYEYLRSAGSDWATGILPLMTEVPPILWTRSMVRHLPYLRAHEAWKYVDDANTHYAVRHLLGRNSPVTIIWLPETDTVSHKQSRGQFGMTRRTIAKADLLIKRVVRELEGQGRLQNTYLMLISDHGHHGGRKTHLTRFDLANDLLYRPREFSVDGEWIGGGLGLSVRQHRSWNRHKGDSSREFVFIDGNSDGVARIFLPRGHYRSNRWMGPSRPADMLAYEIADHLQPINLVQSLLSATATYADGSVRHPLDLVLMKLSDQSLLVSTVDRGQAVIERKKHGDGRWLYKYTPVEDVAPTRTGDVSYRAVSNPQTDPLGLLDHLPDRLLLYFHPEKRWLRMTAETRYPDSVVTLARHMLWQENLKHREAEYAPDLVVTARPGWYFGRKSSPGTMHGYPLADSMRATWFVSGPNIRRGARISDPCRLVDLTPTILEMVGLPVEPEELDGSPLRTIYKPDREIARVSAEPAQPVYWKDVDLAAWQPLEHTPLPDSEYLPITINRPNSPLDLNNIAYNLLAIPDWSVLRLIDDVLFPINGGDRLVTRFVDQTEQRIRFSKQNWAADAERTVNVSGISVGDYNLTSLGNLKRADGAVDWIQRRTQDFDNQVAGRVGRSHLPGTKLVHKSIDTVQGGFWELYSFAQRLVVKVLDEIVINGIENGSDRAINSFRKLPAEIIVEEPQ